MICFPNRLLICGVSILSGYLMGGCTGEPAVLPASAVFASAKLFPPTQPTPLPAELDMLSLQSKGREAARQLVKMASTVVSPAELAGFLDEDSATLSAYELLTKVDRESRMPYALTPREGQNREREKSFQHEWQSLRIRYDIADGLGLGRENFVQVTRRIIGKSRFLLREIDPFVRYLQEQDRFPPLDAVYGRYGKPDFYFYLPIDETTIYLQPKESTKTMWLYARYEAGRWRFHPGQLDAIHQYPFNQKLMPFPVFPEATPFSSGLPAKQTEVMAKRAFERARNVRSLAELVRDFGEGGGMNTTLLAIYLPVVRKAALLPPVTSIDPAKEAALQQGIQSLIKKLHLSATDLANHPSVRDLRNKLSGDIQRGMLELVGFIETLRETGRLSGWKSNPLNLRDSELFQFHVINPQSVEAFQKPPFATIRIFISDPTSSGRWQIGLDEDTLFHLNL